MGVYDPMSDVYRATDQIIILLKDIQKELKNAKIEDYQVREASSDKSLKIYNKGKMVWWKKNPNAACYRLRLFVGIDEIDVIEVDRNKAYHTFPDLVGTDYQVWLEVEDRNGEIIDSVTIYL